MNFSFSEQQEMLRKIARDFVRTHSSLERIRDLFGDELGYSPEVWQAMAEADWPGIVYPEEFGGLGLGYADLICVAEELGRGLCPEPLVESAILGGNLLLHGGGDEHDPTLLPAIARGELTSASGLYELAGRFDPSFVATRAKRGSDGWVVDGSKSFVADATSADRLILSARTAGSDRDGHGISLFVLEPGHPGVRITRLATLDRRSRATVDLEGVELNADALLGAEGEALAAIEAALDRATVALCAEMVGAMDEALQRTVAYVKERVQFGRPIGSFQAVKHKCADMFVTIEIARSALYYAAMAVDQDMDELRAAVSAAKVLCSDGLLQVSKEAIQLHGGIGFTHEHDIALFYKRAVAANVTFGDPIWHRERYAREQELRARAEAVPRAVGAV